MWRTKLNMKTKLILAFLSLSLGLQAQSNWEDTMYAEGKIHVVLVVVGIIFLALVVKLFLMDRKITKLEKEIKQS